MILRVCRRAAASAPLIDLRSLAQPTGRVRRPTIAHRSPLGRFATGPYGSIVSMPTISRFLGLVIAMYFVDHGPPHFHARHADGEAKGRIDTLEPMDSTLGRRQLRLVLCMG